MRLIAALPDSRDTISVERSFVGDQHEALEDCLGNQHPIERVAVRTRQTARRLSVPDTYRQADEP